MQFYSFLAIFLVESLAAHKDVIKGFPYNVWLGTNYEDITSEMVHL